MSYILEALKKLEQKHDREKHSKTLTFSRQLDLGRKKKPIWPYPVFVVLFLSFIVVLWWFQPWKSVIPDTPPVRAKAALPTESTRPIPQPAAKEQAAAATPPAPKTAAAAPAVAAPGKPPTVPEVPKGKAVAAPPVPIPPPEVQARKEKTAPAQEAVPRKERSAPGSLEPAFAVKDLPPFIRNDLPDFRVSGHAYSSDPKTRVARINDKILVEGQELSPGLRVEEIIPEGVVFSYQGYRIRIGVNK
jgi:general secretion pathway protein B